jgi:hypothetical protein
MMNAVAAMVEPDLAGGAIGYIAALGQCGSAIFPWITGALAGKYGVGALQRESSVHSSQAPSSFESLPGRICPTSLGFGR